MQGTRATNQTFFSTKTHVVSILLSLFDDLEATYIRRCRKNGSTCENVACDFVTPPPIWERGVLR